MIEMSRGEQSTETRTRRTSTEFNAVFWLRRAPSAVSTLPNKWSDTVAKTALTDCCSCRHKGYRRKAKEPLVLWEITWLWLSLLCLCLLVLTCAFNSTWVSVPPSRRSLCYGGHDPLDMTPKTLHMCDVFVCLCNACHSFSGTVVFPSRAPARSRRCCRVMVDASLISASHTDQWVHAAGRVRSCGRLNALQEDSTSVGLLADSRHKTKTHHSILRDKLSHPVVSMLAGAVQCRARKHAPQVS